MQSNNKMTQKSSYLKTKRLVPGTYEKKLHDEKAMIKSITLIAIALAYNIQ